MQVIIYPTATGVAVVYPTPEFADQLAAVAAACVPEGQPYRIIDSADLPDASTRPRWQWTSSGPLSIGPEDMDAKRARLSLSFAQLLTGLVAEAWITEAEGTAWLGGTVPAAVEALISTLPLQQRFGARARAARPSEAKRLDPLVVALGTAQGKTAAQLDTFFETYALV